MRRLSIRRNGFGPSLIAWGSSMPMAPPPGLLTGSFPGQNRGMRRVWARSRGIVLIERGSVDGREQFGPGSASAAGILMKEAPLEPG